MSFFGMGPMEILVILAVALVIFGPGKLPEIAQGLGKAVRDFRAATGDLTGELQRTLNEVGADIGSVRDELQQSAMNVQQTTQSVITGMRLDQAPTPASAPLTTSPNVPNPPQGTSLGSRTPTKEDPLADLMPM